MGLENQGLDFLQAVFRSNLSHLLELMGSGKESLTFMKKRTKRLTGQWTLAAQRLAQKLGGIRRDQKQVPSPLCAPRKLSSESLGNKLRAPGFQGDPGSALERVLQNLLEFEPEAGGEAESGQMHVVALFGLGTE